MSKTELFISHSHKDALLAQSLVRVIEQAFQVPSQAIRCSSVAGYELELGAMTADTLRAELGDAKLVLALLTPNSIDARWVMLELGAAWALATTTIPFIAGDVDDALAKMPDPLRMAVSGDLSTPDAVWRLIGDFQDRLEWPRQDRVEDRVNALWKDVVNQAVALRALPPEYDLQICFDSADKAMAERMDKELGSRGVKSRTVESQELAVVLDQPGSPIPLTIALVSASALANAAFVAGMSGLVAQMRVRNPDWAPQLIALADLPPLPPYLAKFGLKAIVCDKLGDDSTRFDLLFRDLWRVVNGPLPDWLDVQCWPSIMSRVTGVAGWAPDEILFADERNHHVARIVGDKSFVLKSDINFAFQLDLDMGKFCITDVFADRILSGRIVDSAFTITSTIAEAAGKLLKRPHGVYQEGRCSLIADTDNNRILIKQAPMDDASVDWASIEAGFYNPCAVRMDDKGIWIADTFNRRICYVFVADKRPAVVTYDDPRFSGTGFGRPVGIYAIEKSRQLTDKNLLFVSIEDQKRLILFEYEEREGGEIHLTLLDDEVGRGFIGSPVGIAVNNSAVALIGDRELGCCWLLDITKHLKSVRSGKIGDARAALSRGPSR
jgi:TIR domain